MTSEPWRTLKFWLEICAAAYVVVGAVLQYSVMAVPFIPTILKYLWPFAAAYLAFRIFQVGRSLYERFTKLEVQVVGNAVDVETRLEEQAKAHRDSLDGLARLLQQEIHNRKQFETQVDNKLKSLEKILREEIQLREKLEGQVTELENRLILKEDPQKVHREKLAGLLTEKQVTRSLADMTAGEILALGLPPLKRKG